MNQLSQIEAMLFVVGEEGISLEELAFTLKRPTPEIYQNIIDLKESYETNAASALTLLEVGNHFVLSTKKEFAPLLKEFARSPMANRLSQAALETLSIIAYKQPVTRSEIARGTIKRSSSNISSTTADRRKRAC